MGMFDGRLASPERAHLAVRMLAALALLAAFACPADAAPKKKRKSSKPAAAKLPASAQLKPKPGEPGTMPKAFDKLAPGELPLKADGAIVIDGYTGKTLYAKNAEVQFYPASTTKSPRQSVNASSCPPRTGRPW